ncbi:MAG: hypothetical protein ACPLXL_00615 [Minisyncoccia bacterium]
MYLENEKERAWRFVRRLIEERRTKFLEYILKAIEIRFKTPQEEYLKQVIELEKRYKFPSKIFRKMNLVVFTSDFAEVKSLEKEINQLISHLIRSNQKGVKK